MAFRKKGSDRKLPIGFEEVVLSKLTGWNYWEIVSQPSWFIERYSIYSRAENIVQEIDNKQMDLKSKSLDRKARRK